MKSKLWRESERADTTLAQRQAEMRGRMKGDRSRAGVKTEEGSICGGGTADPPTRSFEELLKCIGRLGSSQSVISRQDLYDLVWVSPVVNVAKQFGVSDVGLAKTCRSHHIPLPGRGYWAKLQAGQAIIKAAHAIKIARAKEQRERDERAAEEKRRAAYQQWRYEEDKRIRRLDEQLTAWKRAEEVRSYAIAVERAIVKTHGTVDAASELGQWLVWMRDYAARLDPSGREDIGKDRHYW